MPFGWIKRTSDVKIEQVRQIAPLTSSATEQEIRDDLFNMPEMFREQALRYTRSDLVYMCVNRVAEMCAMQAPRLRIYNAESNRDPVTNIPEEEIPDHPFLEQWENPNPWISSFDLLETWAIVLQINGNVYWHLDDGSEPTGTEKERRVDRTKPPICLWPINTHNIVPVADAKTYIKHYKYESKGHKIFFSPDSILHFKRFHPLKALEGLSPIEAANYPSATDISAQKTNWAIFKNQLRVSGVVESDRDTMDLDQLNLMRREIDKMYKGDPEKAHQLLWLWSDFKYKDMGMNLRDAEYVEGAKLNRMRIFGIFGVHPAIILSEDVNRANAEVGEYVTVKFTVMPMLRRLASTLSPILQYWDKRPAEAHFVGVLSQDDKLEATIANLQAETVQRLIRALGPDEGILEAKRRGLLSENVNEAAVFPLIGSAGSQAFLQSMNPEGESYP